MAFRSWRGGSPALHLPKQSALTVPIQCSAQILGPSLFLRSERFWILRILLILFFHTFSPYTLNFQIHLLISMRCRSLSSFPSPCTHHAPFSSLTFYLSTQSALSFTSCSYLPGFGRHGFSPLSQKLPLPK